MKTASSHSKSFVQIVYLTVISLPGNCSKTMTHSCEHFVQFLKSRVYQGCVQTSLVIKMGLPLLHYRINKLIGDWIGNSVCTGYVEITTE